MNPLDYRGLNFCAYPAWWGLERGAATGKTSLSPSVRWVRRDVTCAGVSDWLGHSVNDQGSRQRPTNRPRFSVNGKRQPKGTRSLVCSKWFPFPGLSEDRDTQRDQRNKRSPDYAANAGTVIETLRSDYPHLFERDPNFEVYSPTITLVDRTSGNVLQGLGAYKAVFWVLRLHGKLLFSERSIEITSLFHDEREGTVYIRWIMRGRLRRWVPLLGLGAFRLRPEQDAPGWQESTSWEEETRIRQLEGYSMYYLNLDGWVEQHALDNIQHTRLRLRPLVESILGLGTLQPLRGRQPALHLERLRSGVEWFMAYLRAQMALQTVPALEGSVYLWQEEEANEPGTNEDNTQEAIRPWSDRGTQGPGPNGEPTA
jgi:hypothetical protein